jgi:hypothetical protein
MNYEIWLGLLMVLVFGVLFYKNYHRPYKNRILRAIFAFDILVGFIAGIYILVQGIL